jgi:hypothetical protein
MRLPHSFQFAPQPAAPDRPAAVAPPIAALPHSPTPAASPSQELIAGGVAGGLSKTCVAPLERAKILIQARRKLGTLFPAALA